MFGEDGRTGGVAAGADETQQQRQQQQRAFPPPPSADERGSRVDDVDSLSLGVPGSRLTRAVRSCRAS